MKLSSRSVVVCLVSVTIFERNRRLVLLSGIPPVWFTDENGITIAGLPTYFGKLKLLWQPSESGGILRLGGEARPAQGFLLRLPGSIDPKVTVNGQAISAGAAGEFILPAQAQEAHVDFRR